jgi:hypothetical protein
MIFNCSAEFFEFKKDKKKTMTKMDKEIMNVEKNWMINARIYSKGKNRN